MEKDELTYHVPVLLKESVDGMNIRPDGTYVDSGKLSFSARRRPMHFIFFLILLRLHGYRKRKTQQSCGFCAVTAA